MRVGLQVVSPETESKQRVNPESIFHDPLADLDARQAHPERSQKPDRIPPKHTYSKKLRASRTRMEAIEAVSQELERLLSQKSRVR